MPDQASRLASRLIRLALLAIAVLLVTTVAVASTVVSCSFSGTAGDGLDRGIVVPGYTGNNVRRVQLAYGGSTPGLYRITLTIRRGTFDGPLVGATAVAYLTLPSTSAALPVYFDFGGAPVTPGDTLALIQTVSGPGGLFFDVGASSCGGVAYETEETSPPLDTFRRSSVGISITQDDLTGACIPSDTILCLDKNAGDRRFKVTIDFSHSGGPSGSGQAVPEASLGILHGGTFWFISQDNPEVLVKVLNACGVNNKFWVFATAGTNIGFTLRVLDTSTSVLKTYTNPDNVAAAPVQDTNALTCP
jgi:hypothetical protein